MELVGYVVNKLDGMKKLVDLMYCVVILSVKQK